MKRFLGSVMWPGLLGLGAISLYLWLTGVSGSSKEDALQVTLTAVLVGVTAFYAWSTERIAKQTEKQADATTEATEEIRKQRQDTFRPVLTLVPGIGPQFDDSRETIYMGWWNEGVGPALNARFFVELPQEPVILIQGHSAVFGLENALHSLYRAYLGVGRLVGLPDGGLPSFQPHWYEAVPFARPIPPLLHIVAVYQDIFRNYFESQCMLRKVATEKFAIEDFDCRSLKKGVAEEILRQAGFNFGKGSDS